MGSSLSRLRCFPHWDFSDEGVFNAAQEGYEGADGDLLLPSFSPRGFAEL